MSYHINDRVIVNLRNLNPEFVPVSASPHALGTVIDNPHPGIYNVRLDDAVEGFNILMELGEDRLMPLTACI